MFDKAGSPYIEAIWNNTDYPLEARQKGISGIVQLQFRVSTQGEVQDVCVLKSVHYLLDLAAFDGVLSIHPFKQPAIKNGKPYEITLIAKV